MSGNQVTDSEGHPFRNKKNRPGGDVGGPFFSQSTSWVSVPEARDYEVHRFNGSQIWAWQHATVWPVNPLTLTFPSPIASSDTELDAKGTTAIARSSPTNSVADAATFLGELVKDGLPHLPGIRLWEERIKAYQKLGDEFLNHVFGWLPFVGDIKQIAHGVRRADAVMRQYERDAGKMVRRRYNFPVQRSVDRTVLATNASPYLWNSNTTGGTSGVLESAHGTGDVVRTVETVRKVWFSGAYTYHLPTGYDSRDGLARNAAEAKKVFGATLTPDTLWELTPWSWAIDWFSNAGDVIHNLTSWKAYGLVLRYGYIMEETSTTVTYTHENKVAHPNPDDPYLFKCEPLVLAQTTKIRRPATPFGFGVSLSGLSTIQTAILGALGLTHAH